MINRYPRKDSAGRTWAALFSLITVLFVAGGYWYYRAEMEKIRQEKYQAITAIGELKAGQIVQWRKERQSDARRAVESIFFRRALEAWLQAPDTPVLQADWRKRLQLEQEAYGYAAAILVAPDGRILLAGTDTPDPIDPTTRRAIDAALAARQPVFSDFHRNAHGVIHIDITAPILDDAGRPLAVLVLSSDASEFLYPLIQSWPTPSRSAETLIVRREGEDVVFLNELRHRAQTALSLRQPLAGTDRPAAQAVLGRQGIFEGQDYRDVAVLADLRLIPGSPWFLVAKIDSSEILAEARYRAVVIISVVLLFILLTGAIIGVVLVFRDKRAQQVAQQALRESEAYIKTVLDHLPVGIAVNSVDPSVTFHYMNDNFPRFYRTTRERLADPDAFWNVVYEEPEFREAIRRRILEDCASGDAERMSWADIPITRQGEATTFITAGNITLPDKGLMISTVWDVTERIQAEAALRESEARFRRLVKLAPIPLCYANQDGDLYYFNDRFIRVFGYTPDDIPSMKEWLQLAYPDELYRHHVYGLWQAAVRRAAETQTDIEPLEYNVTCKDGTVRVMVISGITIEDNHLATFIDVTERKRAEEALRQRAEEVERLLDVVPAAVWVASDPQCLSIIGNRWANEYYELDSRENISATARPVGRRFFTSGGQELVASELPMQVAAATNQDVRDTELHVLLPSGRRIALLGSAIPLHDDQGKVRGCIGAFLNITERKRVEDALRESEEHLRQSQKMDAIGQLAGGIAHDFNNMLTGILGYANILKLETTPDSAVFEAADVIEKAAERSADLTRKLLGFARRGKFLAVPVNMNDIVHEVVGLLGRTVDRKIRITQRLGAENPFVLGDPGQLQQVILNLAINARDAMTGGGELTIETRLEELDEAFCHKLTDLNPGCYAIVEVSDTGCGIAAEISERIFEPFFTTKPQGEGTGMGLAMVYGIIQNHDGQIEVDSEVGRGSSFTVYLPLHIDPHRTQQESGPQNRAPGGNGGILVVDDEPILLKVASKMLRKLGYDVFEAANGQAALKIYAGQAERIKLAIIDMVMPEMDGGETLQALRQINPDLKAILCSGFGIDGRAQEIVGEGMQGFIPKPYKLSGLAETVAQVLKESR